MHWIYAQKILRKTLNVQLICWMIFTWWLIYTWQERDRKLLSKSSQTWLLRLLKRVKKENHELTSFRNSWWQSSLLQMISVASSSPFAVDVWKPLADAFFKWIKERSRGAISLEGFLRLYKSNVTCNTQSSYRAGLLQVFSRWHLELKSPFVSRWKRVESLWDRSVSFSIFKVPSLLLRDATGGWRSQSCSWVAHQTLKLYKGLVYCPHCIWKRTSYNITGCVNNENK